MEKHTTTGRWKLGLGLSFVAVFMWGLLPIALKALLRQMDPVTIAWYRFLIAGAVIAIPVARSRDLGRLRTLGRGGILLLAVAALGLSGNYILYVLGLDFTSPAAAQVLIQLAPMFMLLGGLAVYGERFTRWQWVGLAILLTGLVLFFNENLAELVSGLTAITKGVILLIGAAIAWAIYALAQKQLLRSLSAPSIMFIIYAVGSLIFLPVASPARILELDGVGLALLAFLALNTLIAYGSFSEALDHLEASRVGVILAMQPVWTLSAVWLGARLLPAIIDPQRLNALSLIGAGMVVGGSMLGALSRRTPS